MICMGSLVGVFSFENTPEGLTETNRSSFVSYKQVREMVIMNGLEWPMLLYDVIYYEKLKKKKKKKGMQRRETEASMLLSHA